MDSIKKRIQLVIKLIALVTFAGYIMIWIMMPTNVFWLHWLPTVHTKTNSTYLGQQGTNILLYCFPVLLISILGCLYLHLQKYGDLRNSNHSSNAWWRRPVLVKGPLGIVSWTELSFVLMFIALLVWSVSSYVHSMFKNVTRQSASQIHEFVWELKLESVALMLGLVGNISLAFFFFPVTRGSSILNLIGLTSESAVKYHIWLGHTVMTLFTAHGLCYIIYWAKTHQIIEMLKWDKVGFSNLSGEVALFSGIAMWITSSSLVRRNLFELFYYTHHLYAVFVLFFVLHVGFSYICITLPGFYLFLVDRFLRFLQSQQRVRLVSARVLPCQAIELNFSKDPRLSYNPSSIMFINEKSISKLQWHPFTVTSNNNTDPDHLSVVIQCNGNWSRALYEKLSSDILTNNLQFSVEGPYSPQRPEFLRYEKLVMVSGGSGVTPFISIIRELVFASNMKGNTKKVLLAAAFKRSADLAILDLLLPISGTCNYASNLQLQIHAYVTREDADIPRSEIEKLPRTVHFKPSILDRPISATLGSYSWLWLGAIISSSFVVFILLLGLTNRFYIYPIDRNTETIYPHSARSLISIVLLCASLVFITSLAFVWNKRQNSKEMRQIQSADTTPASMKASSVQDSQVRDVQIELESIPQQSLKQVARVFYGQRPNLKKILLECQESDVGVLASGPKRMRQDAAAMCSSVKTLHYQSFSFDW